MIALSLRHMGLKRIGAGFTTLCQAILDTGRGLYAMLSGSCLFIAGVMLTPWMWISLPFARRAPARGGERRWKRFMKACRRIGETVLEWAAFSLVAIPVIVAIVVALHYMDAPSREALTNATNIIYPIVFFLVLGAFYLAGWLAFRLGSRLLAYVGRRLTSQGLMALAGVAAILVAGAPGAVLYAVLKPTFVIALIAGVAVLAGLAGIALISFGPSGVAIFNLGRGGHAPSGRRGRPPQTQSRSLKRLSAQPALVMQQQVVSAPSQAAVPVAIAVIGGASPADDTDPVGPRKKTNGNLWSMPRFSVDRTGIVIGLAVILALLLAWGGGELLLRVAPRTSGLVAQPVGSAAPPARPSGNTPTGTGSTGVIQLGADGEVADMTWRSGYRQFMARSDSGHAVQQLSLPPTACSAAAIVVFGAASSDGSVARNNALAARRARWLAEWTRGELSQCSEPAPAVIAVTLGQARADAPSPAQRTVRVLAIREEDMRDLASRNDPNMLRDMARNAFNDLDTFPRFGACLFASRGAARVDEAWLPACDMQQHGVGFVPSREPT